MAEGFTLKQASKQFKNKYPFHTTSSQTLNSKHLKKNGDNIHGLTTPPRHTQKLAYPYELMHPC